jgi:hypothetical protein
MFHRSYLAQGRYEGSLQLVVGNVNGLLKRRALLDHRDQLEDGEPRGHERNACRCRARSEFAVA